MGFETMGGMKVLALKGIEKQGIYGPSGIPAITAGTCRMPSFSVTPLMQPRQSIVNYSTFC